MSAPHFFYGGGCNDNSDAEDTYFVEIGRIPNSAYEKVKPKIESNYISYAEIKKIRYELKSTIAGDYAYESGVSLDEIRNLLQGHFADPLLFKDSFSFLEYYGNNIFFFELKKESGMNYDPDKFKLYMYVERE